MKLAYFLSICLALGLLASAAQAQHAPGDEPPEAALYGRSRSPVGAAMKRGVHQAARSAAAVSRAAATRAGAATQGFGVARRERELVAGLTEPVRETPYETLAYGDPLASLAREDRYDPSWYDHVAFILEAREAVHRATHFEVEENVTLKVDPMNMRCGVIWRLGRQIADRR